MNRIQVVEVVGDTDGGGTNFVVNLVESLDPARFSATLVAPEAHWIAERCMAAGVTYTPTPLMQSRSSPTVRKQLSRILAQAQADVVHAHGTRAAWYTSRCLPSSAQRSVFLYSEHLFSFDARHGLSRLPWYAIEYVLCRHADAVLTSAPFNARWLLAKGWTTPARLGCDRAGFPAERVRSQVEQPIPRATLGVAEDALLVGSVGRLIPQKGWPYLLQAMASIITQAPSACLIIVGDGEERGALEAQARELGVADHVRFVGSQTNPWSWLAKCDVIALHSLWEGGWSTPLEALAARLPLVVTRVGGVDDYIVEGQTGLIVPPRNAHAMAEALLSLLRDPTKREAMRAAPRDILAEFDVAHVQRTIAALYERVACERQRGASEDAQSRSTTPIAARATQDALSQGEG